MVRPHPRSPLFPYTTLFRSHLPRQAVTAEHLGQFVTNRFAPLVAAGSQTDVEPRMVVQHRQRMTPPTVVDGEVDRKSTRLNSSHVSISYAVFCLKKKKKKDL